MGFFLVGRARYASGIVRRLTTLNQGETAKHIFERAQLPNETLGRIWFLADTSQRGALDLTEFIIAMHLLASLKSGALRALPQILPSGLYEAAVRRGAPPRQGSGSRPNSDSIPASAIPRQFSGGGPQRTASPLASRPHPVASPLAASPTGSDWAISPQDKAQFDHIFATVDTQNRGFITGEQAVGFFSNARLSEEVLAQIWDLADINSEGQLNADEFAVAMYLIRQQRSKKDGRDILPSTLPPNLIPPGMRRQPVAPPQPTAPAFDNAANITAPRSAAEDLFGLDALTSSVPQTPQPAAAPQIPQSTGGSTGYISTSPQLISSSQQQSSIFKPFVPSSSFGQSMVSPQVTGTTSSTPSQGRSLPIQTPGSQAQQSASDDLLGDNDPEISRRLTQETSELANLSNQVGSLSGQMQQVKSKRASTEHDLTQMSTQKRDFETRLSQLRSAYEQEVREVKVLEEKLFASKNETKRLQQDMAMVEGAHQDLQGQHQQIALALDADQKENASLKESIRQLNIEVSEYKPRLEKIRSDARQQKGLVAINKKQLATIEAERERLETEHEEASKEYSDATRELEESERSLQATPPVKNTPHVATSSASPRSQSMNPFFRGTSAVAAESRDLGSPGPSQVSAPPNHIAFDDLFGPSFGTMSEQSVVPQSSFGAESPNQPDEFPPQSVPSGHSVRSSDGPEIPTPAETPPPSSPRQATEPSASRESSQKTSNVLPFNGNLPRSADHTGAHLGIDHGYGYPDNLASTSTDPSTYGQSKSQPPSDNNTSVNETPLEPLKPPASRDLPGAFPDDSASTTHTQPINSANSGDSFQSSKMHPEPEEATREDPFAMTTDNPRSPKDDFDAAFEGFGSQGTAQVSGSGDTPANIFNNAAGQLKSHEFPPIQEFGADEESDSDSDYGFDDNFSAATPPRNPNSLGHTHPQTAPPPIFTNTSEIAKSKPHYPIRDLGGDQLPTPGAQSSPPTYDQTIFSGQDPATMHRDSNQFPAEYTGLLPSREDPTLLPPSDHVAPNVISQSQPPDMTNDGGGGAAEFAARKNSMPQSQMPLSAGATAALYAYDHGISQTQSQQAQDPIAAITTMKDDFDGEFDDLSEAQEVERGEDDLGASHKETFDYFNPTFDSPAPTKSTTQAPQSPFDRGFDDFKSSPSGQAQASTSQQAPQTTNAPHDWDAIFAGLDTPQNNGVQHSVDTLDPRSEPLALPPRKPQLARGLSSGTEHDDPILKRLTGIGYPRQESLNALEKFDYNIDKVSFSTTQIHSSCTVVIVTESALTWGPIHRLPTT